MSKTLLIFSEHSLQHAQKLQKQAPDRCWISHDASLSVAIPSGVLNIGLLGIRSENGELVLAWWRIYICLFTRITELGQHWFRLLLPASQHTVWSQEKVSGKSHWHWNIIMPLEGNITRRQQVNSTNPNLPFKREIFSGFRKANNWTNFHSRNSLCHQYCQKLELLSIISYYIW